MRRIPVTSSNVAEVGHDEETEVLEVQFKGGAVYQYRGVPRDVFDELVTARSVGRYFNDQVKNVYPTERVS